MNRAALLSILAAIALLPAHAAMASTAAGDTAKAAAAPKAEAATKTAAEVRAPGIRVVPATPSPATARAQPAATPKAHAANTTPPAKTAPPAKADAAKHAANDSAVLRAKAARALAAAVKRANDSAVAARKAARADSIRKEALRPPPPKIDSVVVKTYRVGRRPMDKKEMKTFLARFGMKDAGHPESTAVNRVYRDKRGAILTYEPGLSDLSYANETVPMLDEKEYVPDSLIRIRTDALLKELVKDKASGYEFANHEITLVQKKEGNGDSAKISPPVPAFYTGRYLRKLDHRLILGDAFQIRIGYGHGGVANAFSFREPLTTEGPAVKVPTREFVMDSLARWAKSRTRPRTIRYPYHPDNLRVRNLKPIKAIDTFVLTREKSGEQSGKDGTYLVPSVTVLAEATLYRSNRKLRQPPPEGPILLHFHFPCRPEAGLCWPDGKQEMQGPPPPPAAKPATR